MKKNCLLNMLLFFVFFFPFFAFSQTDQPQRQDILQEDIYQVEPWSAQPSKEGDNFQAKFLNMLFILGLLIAFMILASWALKRMMKARVTQINQASLIKVLETRTLSPKSLVYLIEIEGEKILIGESQNGLTYLASFPELPELDLITNNVRS